jgi:taurine transport system substrate-binding protein
MICVTYRYLMSLTTSLATSLANAFSNISRFLSRLFSRLFIGQSSIFLGLLSFGLVVAIAACNASPSPSQTSATPEEFRIGYQLVPNAVVLTKSLKLMENQFPQVTVRWMPFSVGWKVNAAMLAGDIDVGLVGSVPVSTGIAQGLPFQVYTVHDIVGDNEALVVSRASNIKSLADLRSKKIGVPFGTTAHFSLMSAIEQAGLNLEDVTIVDKRPAGMANDWKRGTLDGVFIWQPILSSLKKAGGTVLITARQLAEKGIVTADLGTVSTTFAATYPEFLMSYKMALDEAVQLYRQDPQAAVEAIAPGLNLSPANCLASMNELIWLDSQQSAAQYMGSANAPGAMSKTLQNSARFMQKQKAISTVPSLETFQQALLSQGNVKAAQ